MSNSRTRHLIVTLPDVEEVDADEVAGNLELDLRDPERFTPTQRHASVRLLDDLDADLADMIAEFKTRFRVARGSEQAAALDGIHDLLSDSLREGSA